MVRTRGNHPDRPNCQTEGCDKGCQNTNTTLKPRWRKYCMTCHVDRMETYRALTGDHKVSDTPCCNYKDCRNKVTILGTNHDRKLKFTATCPEHTLGTFHLAYRLTYCENVDSRLGFECTTTIHWKGMLDVDHIDGDPYNNNPDGSNYQTLCKCCHAYKTNVEKDYLSPGRKAGKLAVAIAT